MQTAPIRYDRHLTSYSSQPDGGTADRAIWTRQAGAAALSVSQPASRRWGSPRRPLRTRQSPDDRWTKWQRKARRARRKKQPVAADSVRCEILADLGSWAARGLDAALSPIETEDHARRRAAIVGGTWMIAEDLTCRRGRYRTESAFFRYFGRVVDAYRLVGTITRSPAEATPTSKSTEQLLKELWAAGQADAFDGARIARMRDIAGALRARLDGEVDGPVFERFLLWTLLADRAAIKVGGDPVARALAAATHSVMLAACREALRRGDKRAQDEIWAELWTRMMPRLQARLRGRFLRKLNGRPAPGGDVDDLAQDLLVDAWMCLRSKLALGIFNPCLSVTGSPVGGFLESCAYQSFLARMRTSYENRARSQPLDDLTDNDIHERWHELRLLRGGDDSSAEERVFRKIRKTRQQRAVKTVLSRMRARRGRQNGAEALRLRLLDGHSFAEIGQELGLRTGAARQLTHRAMLWWKEMVLQDSISRSDFVAGYGGNLDAAATDVYMTLVRSPLKRHSESVAARYADAIPGVARDELAETLAAYCEADQMADQAIDGRARHRGRRNPSTAAQLRTLQTALANAALLVDRASIETFRHFFLDVTVMSCGRIRRRLPGMSDLAEELGVSVTTVYVRCARVARLITGRPAEQRPAEPRRRLVG